MRARNVQKVVLAIHARNALKSAKRSVMKSLQSTKVIVVAVKQTLHRQTGHPGWGVLFLCSFAIFICAFFDK
ncbi:hypothetical protein COU75_03605 [Candidatus Peregrinibacteria bacterium CG10_big_fil_rev_8_21_14_0_10_42_8]|nr:MAG: hypothetical protein COU75_03605 [Candidatus Peregrinibacteria bacterium CG10_big_fil_rev_8_21_14_0_10_42_8]